MAIKGDYKKLYLEWLTKTHSVGSPELDALIDISINSETPKDYFIEVSLGNVAGTSSSGKVHRSDDITNTSFMPIWGGALPMVFPTSSEDWEILSSSADDSAGGIGARKVLVNYLDDNYAEQSVIVDLNGLTAVSVASDCFRPVSMIAILSGSEMHNVGLIIIQSTSGDPRGYIKPEFSSSQDTYSTVPAGKTMVLIKASPYIAKNDSGKLKGRFNFFGTNTTATTGVFPSYQNTYDIGFEAPFVIPEKTDFWYEFKSDNAGPIEVNFVTEFILKDN
jgi:hypothetical protein